MKDFITLNQLYKSKKISWIESFATLRKWIVADLNTNNYLQTKVINRSGTGTRYYVPVQNIDAFVNAFHEGKIFTKENKEIDQK